MPSHNLSAILTWFEAFNTQNLELLLSLYDDDAEHFSPKLKIRKPETEGWIRGKEQLREWWQDAFDRLPELRYQPNYFIVDGEKVFSEYLRTVPGEADLIVGEVMFFENGKIVKSKVFHG
jgi:ketosteroid isomerase-like protein